jgi:hypothetical protein
MGSSPQVVDFNSDGRRDLVAGDRSGYFNTFTDQSGSLVANYMAKLADSTPLNVAANSHPFITDWNRDGKKDLIMGDENYEVRLYLNVNSDANPKFQGYTLINCGANPISIYRVDPVVVDLDRDGKRDLVCGSSDAYLYYFHNTGSDTNPTFTTVETLKTVSGTYIRPAPNAIGSHVGFCDWNNDGATDLVLGGYDGFIDLYLGENPDVGVSAIVVPGAFSDSGIAIVPGCSLANFGSSGASYNARLRIGSGYNSLVNVPNHPAGTRLYVTFPAWTPGARGSLAMSCSTELSGDANHSNDRFVGSTLVRVLDAEALSIAAPVGSVDSGASSTPQANVRNNGNTSITFDIRLAIGAWSNTQTVTLGAGASQLVDFAAWTAPSRGNIAITCSTRLAGDLVPANNRQTGSIFVRVLDVEPVTILAPANSVDSGATLLPQAGIRNDGNTTVTFDARFDIPGGYTSTQTVTGLAPGVTQPVSFASWTAPGRGSYTTKCTTMLSGDMVVANDPKNGGFIVSVHDVAALAIVAPAESIAPGQLTPQARVHNYGTLREPTAICFKISPTSYSRTVVCGGGLPLGRDTVITFAIWNAGVGTYVASCSTYLPAEQVHANDKVSLNFKVASGGGGGGNAGWTRMADLPSGSRNKAVKDGGCLAYNEESGSDFVYAAKGNGTCEFTRYSTLGNTWSNVESVPAIGSSGRKKVVKKGASMAQIGGKLYLAKGNGTLEWWAYEPTGTGTGVWHQKSDVPAGAKAVKEGSGAAGVTTGGADSVYFLKGSSTLEFFRFDANGNMWEKLADAPAGASGKPFKNGSALAADGNNTIYVLKGSYNELAAYDIAGNTWTVKRGMPLIGNSGSKKKVKDGAGLAWLDGKLYGLKGDNTNEFWLYNPASDSWSQQADMPVGGGKRVKGGGALTSSGEFLYALRGNATLEFWQYNNGAEAPAGLGTLPASNAMGSAECGVRSAELRIAPNPFNDATTISYTIRKPGNVSLQLFDATGKLVSTIAAGYRNAGHYALSLRPEAAPLARGIYLLKFTGSSQYETLTQKLIVQ